MSALIVMAISTLLTTAIIVFVVATVFVNALSANFQFASYAISGVLALLALYTVSQWAYDYFNMAPVGGAFHMLVGFVVVAASTSPLHAWFYGKLNDRKNARVSGSAHG